MKFSKKFSVKIPKDIKIIYYTEQNFIVLIGPLGRKILKLKLKLFLTDISNYIYVTKIKSENLSDNRKKTLRALCGTTVAYLKQIILEISVILYSKIRFIGVGYKVFPVVKYEGQLLQLKLGFSHSIFYKTPNVVRVTPFKYIYIYIYLVLLIILLLKQPQLFVHISSQSLIKEKVFYTKTKKLS